MKRFISRYDIVADKANFDFPIILYKYINGEIDDNALDSIFQEKLIVLENLDEWLPVRL